MVGKCRGVVCEFCSPRSALGVADVCLHRSTVTPVVRMRRLSFDITFSVLRFETRGSLVLRLIGKKRRRKGRVPYCFLIPAEEKKEMFCGRVVWLVILGFSVRLSILLVQTAFDLENFLKLAQERDVSADVASVVKCQRCYFLAPIKANLSRSSGHVSCKWDGKTDGEQCADASWYNVVGVVTCIHTYLVLGAQNTCPGYRRLISASISAHTGQGAPRARNDNSFCFASC
ncbi:hypothetical protein IWZ03DRAFT_384708 [Phyllosticta citriasiana]|uniref:Uncharacterized protein n=1 Tax=Phyllosticta citriasiana TaxID=595635 RepID=A0ABR1KE51_9PEZI